LAAQLTSQLEFQIIADFRANNGTLKWSARLFPSGRKVHSYHVADFS
jgi:hypothetical protein